MRRSREELFWAKVDKTESCWNWTATTRNGYGRFNNGGSLVEAHRYAYQLLVGPIAEGRDLDHLCRNRACVNPSHLEPVSRQTNVLRGEGLAASYAMRATCKNGHPLEGDNVYVNPKGARICKACRRAMDISRYRAAGKLPRGTPKPFCRNGHAMTPENTSINSQGRRCCRACLRANQARYRAKIRESTDAGQPRRGLRGLHG